MSRPLKNKFVEIQVEGSDKIYKRFDVKLPFPVNVESRPITHDPNKQYGTMVKCVNRLFSEKEGIIKDFHNLGYEVVDIKQLKSWLTELCPQCKRRGIPKIELKDNEDRRVRTWRNKDQSASKRLKTKPKEFWLTYDHKTKPRKCRIKQYLGQMSNTFKLNKRKQIPCRHLLEDYTVKIFAE